RCLRGDLERQRWPLGGNELPDRPFPFTWWSIGVEPVNGMPVLLFQLAPVRIQQVPQSAAGRQGSQCGYGLRQPPSTNQRVDDRTKPVGTFCEIPSREERRQELVQWGLLCVDEVALDLIC